jgi:hypothetical protein
MCYHKNAGGIYPQQWINEYRDSILYQEQQEFDIHEVNYGDTEYRIFSSSVFEQKRFPTFVHCMNYLLGSLFTDGYDCVLNTNADDKYSSKWVAQVAGHIAAGYDLVSCNFVLFQDDKLLHRHHFDRTNIAYELSRNHNVICHPAVGYSKKFWERGNRYVPEEIPLEDLKLWQRAIANSKFIILPGHLCYHRIHDNSVCKSLNR